MIVRMKSLAWLALSWQNRCLDWRPGRLAATFSFIRVIQFQAQLGKLNLALPTFITTLSSTDPPPTGRIAEHVEFECA
jgi:hypothetical protein